jgi:hypothetical protein
MSSGAWFAALVTCTLVLWILEFTFIFILKERYKDMFSSLGSPTSISMTGTFIFGILVHPYFKSMKAKHRRLTYLAIGFSLMWVILLIMMVRSLGINRI